MNSKEMMDTIGLISERHIEEAAELKPYDGKKRRRRIAVSAAAVGTAAAAAVTVAVILSSNTKNAGRPDSSAIVWAESTAQEHGDPLFYRGMVLISENLDRKINEHGDGVIYAVTVKDYSDASKKELYRNFVKKNDIEGEEFMDKGVIYLTINQLAKMQCSQEYAIVLDIAVNPNPAAEPEKPAPATQPEKPGETKPGETEPGETKPGETESVETQPGETKPGETTEDYVIPDDVVNLGQPDRWEADGQDESYTVSYDLEEEAYSVYRRKFLLKDEGAVLYYPCFEANGENFTKLDDSLYIDAYRAIMWGRYAIKYDKDARLTVDYEVEDKSYTVFGKDRYVAVVNFTVRDEREPSKILYTRCTRVDVFAKTIELMGQEIYDK